MQDELTVAGVRVMRIARLLEEFANSEGAGELPSNKREAWNIAQDLKKKVQG